MLCPDNKSLSAFADGELEAATAAEVQEHLSICSACRRFVEEMRELDAWGRSSLRAIAVTSCPVRPVIPLVPLRMRLMRPLALAAAAVIVVGVSLGVWLATYRGQEPHNLSALGRPGAEISKGNKKGGASANEDFARWTAPYRQLGIPLVSAEEAGRYAPPRMLPSLPDVAAHYAASEWPGQEGGE
jgi:hypothetical protein